jgi:hypothetical protein
VTQPARNMEQFVQDVLERSAGFRRLRNWALSRHDDSFGFSILGFKVRWGVQSVTWAGASPFSDFPAVTHSVGKTPVVVLATAAAGLAGSKFVVVTAFSYGSSTFLVQGVTDDRSNPAAASTCPVAWLAIG